MISYFHLKWFRFQINKVRDAVEQCDSKDLKKEFENIEKALKDRGLIDAQVMLLLILYCTKYLVTRKRKIC